MEDFRERLKTGQKVILDLDTPLETALSSLGLTLSVSGGWLVFNRDYLSWAWGAVVVGVICLLLRLGTDNHYILDFDLQHLLYHRRILFFKQIYSVSRMADLCEVTTSGHAKAENYFYEWTYGVFLVPARGPAIEVTKCTSDYEA